MASSSRACWHNGKRVVRGSWNYNWSSDRFSISLRDRAGTRNMDFTTCNDHPEWGDWKLIRNTELCAKYYDNPKLFDINEVNNAP